jgi:hypothetical protein
MRSEENKKVKSLEEVEPKERNSMRERKTPQKGKSKRRA